ncbi:polysaccharide pyruvyl transferase family protein [Zunongwangia sp. HGR-M22]|uniref:polysaccharide pyruvyl transferase family protein n=1 Tax=Zunongwangia sp. HGR-M22 TaxID=3015168 RepID=UPI0022DE2B2D|nr:polysaccharide pyruvyl transferase family protein [Zunongwangia sp. HGR-M22]WBL24870.1 polysaccharide pyruvyl transferase family protein [Zunongwangia sp. HGR-M22]
MSGNKKIIHFLSASDRLNYGDLLFPIIFKEMLNRHNIQAEFYNYGIVKSDLSYFGAMPTRSYRSFMKNVKKQGGNVVIGGGEVLFVDWGSLLAFINIRYSKLLYNKVFSRIERRFNLTRYLLSNGHVLVPFAPSKNELNNNNVCIIYNSVGGVFSNSRLISKRKLFARNISSANYLSVRDARVKESLLTERIKSKLVPDSALIISDLFSIEEVCDRISFNPEHFKDYIFLQVGKPYTPKDKEKFYKSFVELSEDLNTKILLCPIGLAPRHEDDYFLKEMQLYSDQFIFFYPKNVYDIMYLIGNSKIYVGTSLHGLITAQSFSVPFVPINNKIKKLKEYCNTWTSQNIDECIEYDNISSITKIFNNWNYLIAGQNLVEQKNMVYGNFENIFLELKF